MYRVAAAALHVGDSCYIHIATGAACQSTSTTAVGLQLLRHACTVEGLDVQGKAHVR